MLDVQRFVCLQHLLDWELVDGGFAWAEAGCSNADRKGLLLSAPELGWGIIEHQDRFKELYFAYFLSRHCLPQRPPPPLLESPTGRMTRWSLMVLL